MSTDPSSPDTSRLLSGARALTERSSAYERTQGFDDSKINDYWLSMAGVLASASPASPGETNGIEQ